MQGRQHTTAAKNSLFNYYDLQAGAITRYGIDGGVPWAVNSDQ
jgi:hypothetical protein